MNLLSSHNLVHNIYNLEHYPKFFHRDNDSFNNPIVLDIEGFYNQIVLDVPHITVDQRFVLGAIFRELENIQLKIDPNRLKPFSYSITEDEDIVLYRNSSNNIINLIIHPEDDFSLSIINKYESDDHLEFYDNVDADFEHITYCFLR